MLHLSLIRLPRDRTRWHHLDAYGAHRLAWSAFDGVPPGERPFLFSHDTRGDVQSLLVQSTRLPDWGALGPDADVHVKAVDASALNEGSRLSFALRANPTASRVVRGDETRTDARGVERHATRRVGVGLDAEQAFARMGRPDEAPATPAARAAWREAELSAWLSRQGECGGFSVEALEVGPTVSRRVVRTDARGRPGGRAMTFHEVEFSGALRVTDGWAFAETRAAGVGRGRSFGFGLLLLRAV